MTKEEITSPSTSEFTSSALTKELGGGPSDVSTQPPNIAVRRHNNANRDTEHGPTYTKETDPLHLSRGLKSPSELSLIKARTNESNSSKKRFQKRASPKAIRSFYESQNENIQRLLKSVEEHRSTVKDQRGDTALKYKIAVTGSLLANLLLTGLQLFAAIRSGSLSLFTTMADAIFDPMSNITLILSHRAINRVDSKKFPSGKARLENVGNIFFAFLMSAVSLIIIAMSARELGDSASKDEVNTFHYESVIAVGSAFFIKLVLFLYCWTLKGIYSDVEILWQDHRNDLIVNAFGIMTSVGGSKLKWWIDPLGAICLSILLLVLWQRTCWGEFMLLVGKAADPEIQQLITYISMTHSSEILQIDTVRAYHSGPRLIIEVDIVMDSAATLRHTHDIAEELQVKLESLPNVERAYVHVDFETSHKPEHFVKKEL